MKHIHSILSVLWWFCLPLLIGASAVWCWVHESGWVNATGFLAAGYASSFLLWAGSSVRDTYREIQQRDDS